MNYEYFSSLNGYEMKMGIYIKIDIRKRTRMKWNK